MGLGAATPAHRGALLWLVTWHCHLPLLAAQMTASGAEDAGALREAKAAADTSACTCPGCRPGTCPVHWCPTDEEGPCPLDSWTADTEPCGDGYHDRTRGWVGVMCDAPGGRVVYVNLGHTSVRGELLPFFGKLGALLFLSLNGNAELSDRRLGGNLALRGDVADLAGATELRYLDLHGCPLVVGEATALAALVHLGEEYTVPCSIAESWCDDGLYDTGCSSGCNGGLELRHSGVHGSAAALRALPGLGPDWDGFDECFLIAHACLVADKTMVARLATVIGLLCCCALAELRRRERIATGHCMACVVAFGFVMLRLHLFTTQRQHGEHLQAMWLFALTAMCCFCGNRCSKRRERIGVGAQASAATSETSKRGALRKLGGKQHDQWQPVEVELSASGGLSWTSGSASRDRLAGSQKTLTPEQMLSVAYYSDIGVEHAFEVVSSAKGGKVYKFSAESESGCDGWMAAISGVIDLHNGGGASDPAVASFPNPSSGGEEKLVTVAEATVRTKKDVHSNVRDKLPVGTVVTVLEQAECDGHARVRIGENRWVSRETAKGRVLLKLAAETAAAAAPFELDVGVAGGQLFEAKLKRQHVRLQVGEDGLVVFDIEGSEIDTHQFKDLASWTVELDGQLTMVSSKSTTVKAKEASTIADAMTAAATLLAQQRREEKRRKKAERRQCGDPNPSSAPEEWRVLQRAAAKRDASLSSEYMNTLEEGTVLRALERRRNSTGQERVRCSKGWLSVVARDGSVMLEKISSTSMAAAPFELEAEPSQAAGGAAAPFELEAEPSQVAGGAAAPFEMEMGTEAKPQPEPEPDFALDAV